MVNKIINSLWSLLWRKQNRNNNEKLFSLTDLINDPEKFILKTYVEGDELVVRIKKNKD